MHHFYKYFWKSEEEAGTAEITSESVLHFLPRSFSFKVGISKKPHSARSGLLGRSSMILTSHFLRNCSTEAATYGRALP